MQYRTESPLDHNDYIRGINEFNDFISEIAETDEILISDVFRMNMLLTSHPYLRTMEPFSTVIDTVESAMKDNYLCEKEARNIVELLKSITFPAFAE